MTKQKESSNSTTSPAPLKPSPKANADTSLSTRLLTPSELALLEEGIRYAVEQTKKKYPEIDVE